MTHFRTSATTPETGTSPLCAAQLVSRPGTLPTITFPVVGGRTPAVEDLWQYLAEPAEFFGFVMPDRTELEDALTAVTGLAAGSVTVTLVDTAPRILVSASGVTPWRPEAVRVADDESVPPAHRVTDAWWLRMAARTSSKGELDQRRRWLNQRGYADGLSGGEPLLGALVFQTARGVVGVENPEPTSVLDQLSRCGALLGVERAPRCPVAADRVWWVSPRFETQPVAELAGTPFPVDVVAAPSFQRWS